MANKKEVRDKMVALIFMTESGKYKSKKTGELVTLENLVETDLFKKVKAELAEKKISRTSVYKAIENKGFWVMDKEEFEPHLKRMHEFCYTHLDKN